MVSDRGLIFLIGVAYYMKKHNKILYILVVAVVVMVATTVAVILLPKANNELEQKVFEFGIGENRIVIYRQYDSDSDLMTVRHGPKEYKVSNLSYLKTKDLQPYYMTLSSGQDKIKADFSTKQDSTPWLQALPPLSPLEQGLYENTNENLGYKGSWIVQNRAGPSNDSVHTATEKESTVEFSFSGSALEIGLVKYDDRVSVELCIDDKCENISTFSDGLVWQSPYLVTGLEEGIHLAKLRLLKGKAVDLDWVRIIGNKKILTQDNAAEWSNFIYASKGWSFITNQGNTVFRSPRGYSKMGFDAKGRQLEIAFLKSMDGAETEVCINQKCRILNLMSFVPEFETHKFKLDPNTKNHVTILKKQGRFVEIRNVKII